MLCLDDLPCGAQVRWLDVNDTARAFFAELTVADLLSGAAPSRSQAR
jgi:hypothetical protein